MRIFSKHKTIDGNEFLAYAKNYERAAKILLREISEYTDISKIQYDDPKMDDILLKSHEYGLFLTLFAVRDYLELQHKELILVNYGEFDKIKKTHILQKLLNMLEGIIGEGKISEEIKQYVQKLHDYDFSSEGLRYPYGNDGIKIELGSPEKNISNSFHDRSILVKKLQENFSNISRDLENLEGDLEAEEETRREQNS